MGKTLQRWFLSSPGAGGGHVLLLDGLRGLAVLIVIGSHLSNAGWLPFPNLSGIGKSGVYLFFVLSAYLLANAMLGLPLADLLTPRYWLNYALRRILRIWPLYLLILLLSWCLTRAGVSVWHYQIDTAALKSHLALQKGQSVLWSIPVEFTFYLWLPFIVLALQLLRGLAGGRWLGLALLVLLVLLANWCWPAREAVTNSVLLGQYLVLFLCGVAAAWVRRSWLGLATNGRIWRGLAWVLLALLVLVTPSVWAELTGGTFQSELNHRWFTAFGLGWALLLLALPWGGGLLARFFASAPMRLVGVVSFSAYLWHMPVLQAAKAAGVREWGWVGLCLLLMSILLTAMVSFLLFERPWRNVRYGKG
ncbi:acyltransferase family protein [Stenotrophomonas sp. NLF4-10]|uniref:acyltransferase family protein n=1 Tax=Stenotrophomonas sp. NLF4-10 TaxID=2918754 RepID=UPI001EFB234E|nr:acyltransferase family protein [Stenotrophomonas sp. NLF4-10]MCG8277899.1 acyltransferase family protein [Stenotrophomonas sp. NLF4-10]